jgi:hypothetical protein
MIWAGAPRAGGDPSLYVLEHKLFGGKVLPEPAPRRRQ